MPIAGVYIAKSAIILGVFCVSIAAAKPSQGWMMNSAWSANDAFSAENLALSSVPRVAITAMRLVWLSWTAGFRAGSTPTSGKLGYSARSSLTAAAVAVLQATTKAFTL